MMKRRDPNSVSEAVRRFLTDEVGSVERLDLLLFLARHPARWRSAQALAEELGMPAHAAQLHLEHFSARNLLAVRLAESVLYRYEPAREELSELVGEVVQAHFLFRDNVLALLTRPASDSARLFAEAVQLRKDKREG
jgi:3-oxoacyl-[acyl-carrier-protein] synthase III